MPLTRATITAASRIMLPAHALFSVAVGLIWVLQDDGRTDVRPMSVLRIWPISSTGTVLVILAATVMAGMITHQRTLTAVALGAGMLVYLGLAAAFTVAIFTAHASISGPIWPLYVATAHLASVVSLAYQELTELPDRAGGVR